MDDIFGGGQPGGGNRFSSFFETLFGGGNPFEAGSQPQGFRARGGQAQQQPSTQKRDIKAEVEISLREAYSGTTRTVRVGSEKMKVKIPAGIEDGQRLKLTGKGGTSSERGPKGDLLLTIRVNVPKGYERKGDDVYYNHPLDLYTAILGGETVVQTLNGKAKLNIPAGTSSGKLFRLSKLGMPKFRQPSRKGDFLVRIQIKVPEKLSDEEKEVFKKLAAKSKS